MRIVLAEQQASARSALRILIRAQEDLDLVGEAANAAELYSTAEGTTPDLIVFDFDGFDQSVADVFTRLRQVLPATAVIGMSVREEKRQVALSCGADGFAYKGDPPECLLGAVRRLNKPK